MGFGKLSPRPLESADGEGEAPRQAELALAAARGSGNRRQEVAALIDLGIACQRGGDAQKALGILGEALLLAQTVGDETAERDARGSLGLASISAGDVRGALTHFEAALKLAREAGDLYVEKIALNGLGLAWSALREPARALAFFEEALGVARELGDRAHEAKVLWYVAVELAELGRREEAVLHAERSVGLLERAGNPQARWFAEHLGRFRVGEEGKTGKLQTCPTGAGIVASVWTAGAEMAMPPAEATQGPGVLRMAVSAGKAMAKFLGSGCKRVTPEVYARRLEACGGCGQFTGMRCRVCGCFTRAKALLRHEECPLGKWRTEDDRVTR